MSIIYTELVFKQKSIKTRLKQRK